MSGHFICEYCGYDGGHAAHCRQLRPASERWRGNRTKEEMEQLREERAWMEREYRHAGEKLS